MEEQKFVQDLSQLVSFETVSGQPNGFNEAIEFIKKQISPRGIVEVLPNNGAPILLASNVKTKTPDICYLVHLDVVHGRPEQFTMRVDKGYAYGRGVSDMKFSIPVGYSILNTLIDNSSKASFMLAITTDEERGGFKGAGFLADEYNLKPKLLIVPDGGDNFVLINKSKGVCQLKITKHGKPAHSSHPWEGESAVNSIVKLASNLLSLYETSNSKAGWHTTMNIGTLTAGKLLNQVASDAELCIDFRFPPEHDSVESLTKKVADLAKAIDPTLEVTSIATGIAPFTDPTHPAIQIFLETLKNKIGREVAIEGGHGSNDARHFNKYNIPYIMIKPDGGDIHGDNEHISIKSTIVLYETILEFIEKYI